jgi:hypothetical protein
MKKCKLSFEAKAKQSNPKSTLYHAVQSHPEPKGHGQMSNKIFKTSKEVTKIRLGKKSADQNNQN